MRLAKWVWLEIYLIKELYGLGSLFCDFCNNFRYLDLFGGGDVFPEIKVIFVLDWGGECTYFQPALQHKVQDLTD